MSLKTIHRKVICDIGSTHKNILTKPSGTPLAAFVLFFLAFQLLFFGITVPFLAGDRRSRFLYDTRVPRRFANAFFHVFIWCAVKLFWGSPGFWRALRMLVRLRPQLSFRADSSFFYSWLNPRFSERSLAYRHTVWWLIHFWGTPVIRFCNRLHYISIGFVRLNFGLWFPK